MFKSAIFDLDGVIVNTVPIHFKAWKKMFSEYGINFSFEDYEKKVDGIPRYFGTKAILTDFNEAQIKEASDKKQGYFLEFIEQEEIPVYTSTINLIKEMKNHNKKIAVASSSKNCRKILQKVNIIDLADAIVDGNDLKKGKPDPFIFQISAQMLDSINTECIVFEDAVLGVEAAVNAKMLCVGIDRYNNPERLSKADIIVKDLSETNYSIIEGLFKNAKA